ncbi:peptidase associated/transthyretin-like domain-containing protein [Psychroflexus aestuariivivens]|uniref:hypothetical protein n=1 Tax=Psychroflexus aestuariivivens TaxID=1795040 RepID=UPI000FDC8E79|nr:hypothetical protein [Psychroflexus aestuariivivens]
MKSTNRFIFKLISACLLLSLVSCKNEFRNNVVNVFEGKVVDENNQPVENLKIFLGENEHEYIINNSFYSNPISLRMNVSTNSAGEFKMYFPGTNFLDLVLYLEASDLEFRYLFEGEFIERDNVIIPVNTDQLYYDLGTIQLIPSE